jgi:hypothetical protein
MVLLLGSVPGPSYLFREVLKVIVNRELVNVEAMEFFQHTGLLIARNFNA